MKDDKKLYEVYVAERDLNKRLISRRKRGISSEREARQIEFNFKTELKITAQQKPILTWASWKVEVLKRVKIKFKNATLQNYESYLKKWVPPSWDPLQITEIKSEDIYNALELSGSGLSSISKHTFLKILKRIFQEAVESGHLLSNPAKGISVKVPESSKKVLTTTEVEILLRSAKDTNHRFYSIWCFAVKTGMRSGEMYALQWSDIDFERRLISVNKQWTKKDGTTQTKTGDNRLVPISNDLLSFLIELKNSSPDQPNALPHLIEWTHGEQAKVLKEFCQGIGITDVKFHDLRATFITNMLSQGVALVKVMSIVGHKKMETTDIYLRLAGVDIRGATEALSYSVPVDVERAQVIPIQFGSKN